MFKVIDTFILHMLLVWIDFMGKITLQKHLRFFCESNHRQVLVQYMTLI